MPLFFRRRRTSDLGPRTIVVFCVYILSSVLSSCTPRQPIRSPEAVTPSRESGIPTAQQLLASVQARQQQTKSVRGLARVTYKDSEEKGSARQAVAVSAPDHFRVELFSPIGIAALVTTDGQQLAAYFPKEKTIYRGAASAEHAGRFLRIVLSVSDISSLLLGLPFSLPNEQDSTVRRDTEHDWYVLSAPINDENRQTLVFDTRKHQLLKWEVQNPEGTVLARMELADYRTVQGQEFPHEILLTDIQGGQEAGIYYEQVELNPVLTDTLFTLKPITGVQEENLDASSP
jgi:outer membrane lipoprotein-sorting protein